MKGLFINLDCFAWYLSSRCHMHALARLATLLPRERTFCTGTSYSGPMLKAVWLYMMFVCHLCVCFCRKTGRHYFRGDGSCSSRQLSGDDRSLERPCQMSLVRTRYRWYSAGVRSSGSGRLVKPGGGNWEMGESDQLTTTRDVTGRPYYKILPGVYIGRAIGYGTPEITYWI